MSLFTQDDDSDHKAVVWIVLGAVIVLAVGLAVGMGLWRTGVIGGGTQQQVATAPVPLVIEVPAPVTAPAQQAPAADDAPRIQIVDGVVRFYFATGKAELAAGAGEALAEAIQAAQSGKKLVISGFHDSTGSAEVNAAIAKKRAFAVRDALLQAGIPADSLELKKPEAMPNTQGSDPEARRVDVSIQH